MEAQKEKKRFKTGRPKAVIDWAKVDRYLQAQCEGTGIAGLLGVHPNTLYEACKKDHKISFSEYSANKKSEGKEILRAKQFQVAMEGDKTMLVWLGKQYLEQKEKSEVEATVRLPRLPDVVIKTREKKE